MKSTRAYASPLRERQTEETRQRIVNAALALIATHPEGDLSHEAIARRAEIALRTVYRHFPSRPELLDAVWAESDRRLALSHYPSTEAEMLAFADEGYRMMDRNADLIRGLLNSDAGREMRRRDNPRRYKGLTAALENATRHLAEGERRRVVGVFQVLFGGRTWEMLRDRAYLKDGEASDAVTWAMQTLLKALYDEQARRAKKSGKAAEAGRTSTRQKTKKDKADKKTSRAKGEKR